MKILINLILIPWLFYCLSINPFDHFALKDNVKASLFNQNTIDRNIYYNALSGNSLTKIDSVLLVLEGSNPGFLTTAYKGGLLMKKSSLLSSLMQKWEAFKQGKALLEAEISAHSWNAELRFIRLIIQEHAPSFLKYNSNIESDKQMVVTKFNALDKELKENIIEYSKQSKILLPSDFN